VVRHKHSYAYTFGRFGEADPLIHKLLAGLANSLLYWKESLTFHKLMTPQIEQEGPISLTLCRSKDVYF
jgi:hypothetical protein